MTNGYHQRREIPWGVGDIFLAVAISLGAFGVFFLAISAASGFSNSDSNLTAMAWLAALVEGALLFAVWLIVIKRHHLSWESVGLRAPTHRHSLVLAAAALAGSLAFTAAYGFAVSALGIEFLMPEPIPVELVGEGAYIIITALALGGWVPFVEEVFFRGFLFTGLTARYGLLIGTTASAALFALVHFSLATILPIFVTGILFALVYHRTGSIWIPISAHSAQNLIALIAARYAPPAFSGSEYSLGIA